MKTYKNIITGGIALCVIAIASTGCKKFLDRPSLSATTTDLAGGAGQARVLGLYGAVRNSKAEPFVGDGMQNIPWVAMNGFRSDDAEIVADPGAAAWHQTYDNFQYTKDDWGAGMYWDKHYVMIGLCNQAIAEVEKAGINTQNDNVLLAEARFWRAYTYFEMVRTFGDVPKIDFVINQPADGQIEKSPAADIWAFINEDLTFADANLPLEWEATYAGRLTSGASKTLHAKALIYQQQWTPALSLLEQVIATNEYSLAPNYAKMFKTEGELNQESILEIQAAKDAGDGDTYWSRYGQCQGVRGSGDWDLGWGWNTPTASLVSSYEAGDLRKDGTILFSGQFDGGPETGGYGATVDPLTNALYWNKKVYNTKASYVEAGLGTPNNEAQNTWVNYRALRYADVLLLAAEAANEIGGTTNTDNAETWVNMIRNRAGLADISYTTQGAMRDEIKKQRRAEFAMEMERFFDLVRWNDAIGVLGPLGYQNKHRYYPIPSGALNDNPNLTQNPEWP